MKKLIAFSMMLISLTYANVFFPLHLYAISPLQRKLLQSGVYYFDADTDPACPTTSNNSKVLSGDTYIVGDSISKGLNNINLGKQIDQITGGTTTINYDSGRSITAKGTDVKTSGLEAVENDKARIQNAQNIIIVLGTNPENNFEQNLKKLMGSLKSTNPGAQYYWVDIGATRSDLATTWSGYNQIIYNNSATQGYSVISRYKALFGQDKDPLNISAGVQIPGSSDYVHGGYDKLADEILKQFKNGSGATPTDDENKPIEEKVAQLLFVRVNSEQEAKDAVEKYKVGGIYISEWRDKNVLKTLAAQSSPKLFIGIDEEGGRVHRLRDRGDMPSAKTMGSLPNNEITAIATQWGSIMQEYGINIDFAPVVDLDNASSPIIGQKERAFSSDPAKVVEKAGAFAQGLRSKQIKPVFKHFPGHGNSTEDSHTSTATTQPLNQLKNLDLKPYESLLKDPDSMVMMGHLNVPGLSTAAQPTSINKAAYDLLRNEYGFSGVAITDDLGDMKAISEKYPLPDAVEKAINAGADIALFNGIGDIDAIINKLKTSYGKNDSIKKRIDESYTRITKAKGSSNTTNQGTCACIALNGADNKAKIWNFIVSKGLSAPQVAGVMGNLQAESGFEPRRVQYGGINSRGEVSVRGQPSSLDDTMRIDNTTGYGLAQWTSKGRQQGLHDFAVSRGTIDGDLSAQLEWLYKEAFERGDWAKMQQESEAGQAAYIWHKYYEISADGPDKIQNRMNMARAILAEFGSGGSVGGGGSSC